MSSFLTPLVMECLDDGVTFKVMQPFEYCVGALGSPEVIFVEVGFVTDLASIPRFLYAFFAPTGKYTKAAVLHDFMYTKQMYTRARSDSIFLEAMEVLGVGWLTRHSIYAGVRMGGWAAWSKHLKENKEASHDRSSSGTCIGSINNLGPTDPHQ